MDVFFTFLDKINKPIFVLYDKNFIHLNNYLLSSLGFTDKNRPGSLTQIMESKWKSRLVALKQDDEIEIPLIMNGGKIQKYRVKMHQLEIDQSEYVCFILNIKEATDQVIDIANRIFTRLPYPAFTFNKGMEFLQKNETFKNLKGFESSSFQYVKELFGIDRLPDFSKQDFYIYKSANDTMELYLFKPLHGISINYYGGIITPTSYPEISIDVDYVKKSIEQTIHGLMQVEKLYGNQSSITQSIWQSLHNEIISLSQVKRHLDYDTSSLNLTGEQSIDLNKFIVNEIEILKSNDFFRQNVNLVTQFDESLNPLKLKYSDLTGSLVSVIRHIAEQSCMSENNEICIETTEEDDLKWLKIYINFSGQTAKQKSGLFKNLKRYEKQFVDADVLYACNEDSKKNINLSIGFEQ